MRLIFIRDRIEEKSESASSVVAIPEVNITMRRDVSFNEIIHHKLF